jgi:hypothetical protein
MGHSWGAVVDLTVAMGYLQNVKALYPFEAYY